MRKTYIEPELEIREYSTICGGVTTSTPEIDTGNGLDKDDQIDYFD